MQHLLLYPYEFFFGPALGPVACLTMNEGGGGGIFVSYRRKEDSHLAGRLYDRLVDRFGKRQVFMDVNTIEPGVDFAHEISRAVAACRVLLVIIGPTWLTVADERGRRRLDNPGDLVRLEVEAALTRGVRVIPVLAEDAIMPTLNDLPESLAGLARRNAVTIRHGSFLSDAGHLITAIERVLAASDIAATSTVSGARGPRPAGHESTKAARISEPAQDIADSPAHLPTNADRIVSSVGDRQQTSWTLDEDILIRRLRELGEDHPDFLTSMNDFARDLSNLGDYQAAREVDQETLARRRRVLGEDHPDTLTSASNLARDLSNLGDYQAARDWDQDTWIRRLRVLGKDHPDTLTSASNLARDLSDLGDDQAARRLNEVTTARRHRLLGADHPDAN